MSFLVLLLVLLVEKFSSLRLAVQRDGWWLSLQARLQQSLGDSPWLLLALLVLLPVIALALLLAVLEPLAYGLLVLPVHLLVVLYSLGRGDVKRQLGPFRDMWRREDREGAFLAAERDLGLTDDSERGLFERVERHLLWQGFQSFFAVIFWYMLLGPLVALGYRLLALVAEHGANQGLRERASQVRHALDWLPVRALTASFALVGNFVAVNRVLLPELLHWDLPAGRLLGQAGPAAADLDERFIGEPGVARLDALWALLIRAGALWYAVFAVVTLLA
ncbi:regulatory signaling modulator protein AmpE [Stutzerimonas azotifigens]|uniref:Regulatory signaling modulator protein AmpE n=1 Tax=Stutzerimonas azotifigens TaxID=291995 RepID=A0ABR5Z5U5_9GAMM|nr:regulatory signaling modulator protein AmpE [Stutzerimonas azotifigens]MBA1275497.1 regulatory signaling modulator protein AmpE [Stutzerimonas azotifigens]